VIRTAKLALACAFWLGWLVSGATGQAQTGAPRQASPARTAPAPTVTFAQDIAPIVYKNCTVCHHPGGSGPFSLLNYKGAHDRAGQIAVVTKSRYMPPWLPKPGYGDFLGERRLTDQQIETIQEWVKEGTLEGDMSKAPPAPHYNEGDWLLGKPDMVIKLARPYTLRAGGTDVFRNFVFPVPVTSPRYVSAVEIHPGNKLVIHHCNMLVDRSGSSERMDGKDGQIGFGGMEIEVESEQFEPQTHFTFWKPGTPPYQYPKGMSWEVDKGTDLVLNMHMLPSGKPEVLQPVIGLYFTKDPPTEFPMLLELEDDEALDIPAGDKNFTISDSFRLPVDVQVLGVYPHAHYLGKDIEGYATLPDGSRKWLIWIPHWNIYWQAVYPLAKPLFLPAGTIITMKYTYDNSTDNALNPHNPPIRVVAGNRSSDEMGHLWIQVLPAHKSDLKVLQEALMRHRIEKDPNVFLAQFNLGAVLQSEGKIDEAIPHLEKALQVWPHNPTAENNLGAALLSKGRVVDAITHFREALKTKPDYPDAQYNLGDALLALNQPQEAVEHFQAVLRLKPDDANAHNDLGSAYVMLGKAAEAATEFEAAIRLNPQNANAEDNLGYVLAQSGRMAEALPHFQRAVELKPDSSDFHNDLGMAAANGGNLEGAVAEFEQAVRLNPQNSSARKNLETARAQLARVNGGIRQ
jgi:Flp pilus assembly protein TadD/mono/diheme cytochrome c family protein